MITARALDLLAMLRNTIPTDDARREAAECLSPSDRAELIHAQSVSFFDSARADEIVSTLAAMPQSHRVEAFSRMTPADQNLGWARLARALLPPGCWTSEELTGKSP